MFAAARSLSKFYRHCAGLSGRSFASVASLGLDKLGVRNDRAKIYHNLTYGEILEHEIRQNDGTVTANGTVAVDTGKFTGRSPKDKWIVKQPGSDANVWWGDVNQPITSAIFDDLYAQSIGHYNANADKIYVFDGYAGANPASRKKVRFVSEIAWQHHFVTNMFIRPKNHQEVANFAPDFTIVNACRLSNAKWKAQGLNSDVFIAFNIEKRIALIGGTWYGGEMKKGIFSMMNYWLPLEGIMSMHCSANKGKKHGDTALFFGLSGTGKTTLSADPNRYLIGDDEHGWDNDGIFNLEGGCYAKTVNLSPENEPDIYRAIRTGALLENVTINPTTRLVDYTDVSKTENGRVSYPIHYIDNFEPTGTGNHPNNIIFLTCDAFGILPPVSLLTPQQAMYHFLSGYTAKVAGTERGIKAPSATFSACYGAAFMMLHPTKYATLLQKKLETHKTKTYLVNTGWSGGGVGVGSRMSIKTTRACLDAILSGSISKSTTRKDPIFGFNVPTQLDGVSKSVLDPKEAWANKSEYDEGAKKLAKMFQDNFKKYVQPGMPDYTEHGPRTV